MDKNGLREYPTINLQFLLKTATHFEGAAIFWTVLDNPNHSASSAFGPRNRDKASLSPKPWPYEEPLTLPKNMFSTSFIFRPSHQCPKKMKENSPWICSGHHLPLDPGIGIKPPNHPNPGLMNP